MAIERIDDVLRWLDLLTLKPLDALAADERGKAQPVPGAPQGLLGIPMGVRLADWRTVAVEWSDEDRAAMEVFIDERVRPAMIEELQLVHQCQEALRASPATPAGMLAAMWAAGCHPLQDEDGADASLPPSDFGARLGALLRARALLRDNPTLSGVAPQVRDRLEGVLAMCKQHLPLPALPGNASLAEWIGAVRDDDPLAAATARDQTWFPTQVAVECESLWNGAGEALRGIDRALYDILEFAALSGENAV